MNKTAGTRIAAMLIMLSATAGCNDSSDPLVAHLATTAVEEQAAQNRAMAELNKEVVAAGDRMLAMEERLQGQREAVDQQRDELEAERREIAKHRHRDPLIATAILQVGLIAACLAPLVLCFLVLRSSDATQPDAALNELLIEELVDDRPGSLIGPDRPTAIEHQSPVALPPANADDDAPAV